MSADFKPLERNQRTPIRALLSDEAWQEVQISAIRLKAYFSSKAECYGFAQDVGMRVLLQRLLSDDTDQAVDSIIVQIRKRAAGSAS